MKRVLLGLSLLAGLSGAYAFDGLTFYSAVITKSDRYNSNHHRLGSVRDILRQDRANYCKRQNITRPTGADADFFCNKSRRNIFNSAHISISKNTAYRIVKSNRNYTVCVIVLTKSDIKVRPGRCPNV